MNDTKFKIGLKEVVAILKELHLLVESCLLSEYGNYSDETIASFSTGDLRIIYNTIVEHRDYEIQLFDQSLIQFDCIDGENRYAFIQNPQEFCTFEDFLEDNNILCTTEDYEEAKNQFYDDYSQYLSEMRLNEHALYIRYDEDSKDYMPGIHSYAHIHIGLGNSIRIPMSVSLTPTAFILFILKHVYYDIWVIIKRKGILDGIIKNYKSQCVYFDREYWKTEEENDLFIK